MPAEIADDESQVDRDRDNWPDDEPALSAAEMRLVIEDADLSGLIVREITRAGSRNLTVRPMTAGAILNKVVTVALAKDGDGFCYMSLRQFARQLKAGKKTIERAMRVLVGKRLLRAEKVAHPRRRGATVIRRDVRFKSLLDRLPDQHPLKQRRPRPPDSQLATGGDFDGQPNSPFARVQVATSGASKSPPVTHKQTDSQNKGKEQSLTPSLKAEYEEREGGNQFGADEMRQAVATMAPLLNPDVVHSRIVRELAAWAAQSQDISHVEVFLAAILV